MKKKISIIMLDVTIIFSFAILIFFSYKYISNQLIKKHISNEIKEELILLNESNIENKSSYTLDYYKNYYSNDDIVGRLKIYDTKIDTLLVQGTNNDYYLNHTLEKKYSVRGSIFVDYRTNLNSKHINIYGHNSNVYNLMFKELENYLDSKYYENHKYIELWNGVNTYIYEIFSIQIITSDYEHMDTNPIDWSKHISKLNNSIYDTKNSATIEDEILVIQTCIYKPNNSFLLLNAKKI